MVIGTVGSRGTITVPAELRERLGIHEGDQVSFEVDDNHLVITPVRVIPRDQAWFWTEEWQTKEREADEDITAGRTQRFESDEEFLTALRNV